MRWCLSVDIPECKTARRFECDVKSFMRWCLSVDIPECKTARRFECDLKSVMRWCLSVDIPECKTARRFECDLVEGYCEDLPVGSFTCKCNPGFELVGKKCVGK